MVRKYSQVITQVVIDEKQKEFVESTRQENRNLSTAEIIRWSIDVLQEEPRIEYGGCSGKFTQLITNSVVTASQYEFIHARADRDYAGNVSAAVRDAIAALQLHLHKPEEVAA